MGPVRAPPYSEQPGELFGPEAIADPQRLYARLREQRPISRVADTGVHLVATWDLIDEALGREADFSANLTGVLIRGHGGEPGLFEFPDGAAPQVIATADEPGHAVHRRLAQPRLAAGRVAALEDPIRAWAQRALAKWGSAGGGDFTPISERIPARVVAALLGLPEGDLGRHRKWAMIGGDMLAGDVDREQISRFVTETAKLVEYLGGHLAAALAKPRSGPDAPMLHALARGVREGAIDREQAIMIAVVMFGAGGESTAALIGSAVRRLAEEREVADALRRDLGLVPRFVEEVARLEPPFKFHYRAVRRACALGGVELAPGDRLMLLWASANRDPGHFEDPDSLRLDRKHPKHHMSFGRGAHFCIGAPIARLEARVVCEELLANCATLSLSAEAPPAYARSIFVRRLTRLPVFAGAVPPRA
jgi:cytochrome P450